MHRLADRIVEALLSAAPWYRPAEIADRERHTLEVMAAAAKAAARERARLMYLERLVGNRGRR